MDKANRRAKGKSGHREDGAIPIAGFSREPPSIQIFTDFSWNYIDWYGTM